MSTKNENRSVPVKAGILTAGLAMLIVLIVLLSAILSNGKSITKKTVEVFSTEITAPGDIEFSEIMSSNRSYYVLGGTALPDWIELHNKSAAEISLDGWAIMRANDGKNMFSFGKVSIPAGGYLLLAADGHADRTTGTEIHLPFKLSSSGTTVVLMNAAGAVTDCVEVPALEKDQVYARDAGGSWQISTTPTPNDPNEITQEPAQAGETAASPVELTVAQDQVYVCEVMSANVSYAPDSKGRYLDYIEIQNDAAFDVSLKDWHLSNDKQNIAKWAFPDDAVIPAGGRILVYCGGATVSEANDTTDLIANFRLASGGCQVILTRGDGQCISLIEVPALAKDQAYSQVAGAWTVSYAPTPGSSNDRSGQIEQEVALRARNASGVTINEVAAATTTMEYDWIELYNGTGEAIDLSGYGLSDNPARPRKWRFPSGTIIQPGGYYGVYCSGLDGVAGNTMNTNFKLSKDGGYTVVLSRPDGTVIDQVYLGPQFTNVSIGRRQDADGWWFFTEATPLSANTTTPYAGKASAPVYSTRGGMFSTGDVLQVELTAQEPGLQIYYTTDNTDPSETSKLYTGPITITSTTILRTRVYGNGYLESYMDTQSYLFDVNNGDNTVHVVSVVSDPYNLTSDEAGILIKGPNAAEEYPYKGANYWQDWEREAHVEVYAPDGSQMLSSECGIKLHGQFSRAEDQQALKILARAKYGNSRFEAPLFSKRPYTSYKSFLLRAAGQDCNMAHMRDPVLQQLASDTSVMYQENEICVVYLDGEYWGAYYMRERICADSICQFEGWEGQEDNIDLVKANKNTMRGSNETFAELIEWIKTADPKSDTFYDHVGSVIDIQNYIEYMSLEIFSGNGDTLNVKRYRNANADGKWRWVLFDLDWAFYVDTNSINRWLTPGGMGTNLYTDNSLFIACMKNPRFRDEFLTYYGQRMATVFTTQHTLELFQNCYSKLQPILSDQLKRWGQSESDYSAQLKKLIDYCKTRPARLIEFFSTTEYLNMTTEEVNHYFGDAIAVINSTST